MKFVRVSEVVLRDGIQNLDLFVETAVKKQILKLLVGAGIREIEVTSFVNPKLVPQFSDAASLVRECANYPGVYSKVLVPNLKGAQLAVEAGAKNFVFVFSASEKHNLDNVNMTINESVEQLKEVNGFLANVLGTSLSVDLSTTFGTIEESVAFDHVLELTSLVQALSIKKIIYCDTSGIAVPSQVEELIKCLGSKSGLEFGFHLHDTFGCAMANALKAVEKGVDILEVSLGGLGGCPFLADASGNLATEDMVRVLEITGFETGISLPALREAVKYLEIQLGKTFLSSRINNLNGVENFNAICRRKKTV